MTTINHPNFENTTKIKLSRNGKNGNGNGNGNGKNHDRHEAIRISVHDLLTNIGEDPEREGLLNTPDRIAQVFFCKFFQITPQVS